MGCCESRERPVDLGDYILGIENSLELKKIPLETIECEFDHYSSNMTMTMHQLQLFTEKIGLSKKANDFLVFEFFHDRHSGTISLVKVITFAVLICPAEKSFKVQTLFKHFDKNRSGALNKNTIGEIIENIFDISVDSIVRLAIIITGIIKSDKLYSYEKKLNKIRSIVVSYLISHFCENKTSFDEYSFRIAFHRLEMNVLLIPRLLRKFAYKIYNNDDIRKKVTIDGARTIEHLDLHTVGKISRKLTNMK